MVYHIFLQDKLLTVFSDGTFAWWHEGNFCTEILANQDGKLFNVLSELFYYDGQFYSKYKMYMQLFWLSILLLTLFSIFYKSNNTKVNRIILTMQLSVIGLIIYEMLFEARARYLFTFVPIFIILAVLGSMALVNKIDSISCSIRKN